MKEEKRVVAVYNELGELEKTGKTVTGMADSEILASGIRNALKTEKMYKNKYFRYMLENHVPDNIEIPFICKIDNRVFSSCANAARYLNVSRQAVQQSRERHSKKIGGKNIIWGDF